MRIPGRLRPRGPSTVAGYRPGSEKDVSQRRRNDPQDEDHDHRCIQKHLKKQLGYADAWLAVKLPVKSEARIRVGVGTSGQCRGRLVCDGHGTSGLLSVPTHQAQGRTAGAPLGPGTVGPGPAGRVGRPGGQVSGGPRGRDEGVNRVIHGGRGRKTLRPQESNVLPRVNLPPGTLVRGRIIPE